MAALPNARHERFAQEITKGSTGRDAYKAAGYETKGDAATDAAASRLLSDVRVQARIAEIQERAATRVEISVASVTENLARIAAKAEALAEASGLSVARAAWMDAAKLNGLAPDKLQLAASVGIANTAQPASLEELGRWAREALGDGGQGPD
jgi:hypothetical protein